MALVRLIAKRTWQHVDLYTCFVTPVHTLCKHEFDTMQAVCGRCTPPSAHPSSVYDICALCTARSAPNQASAAYTVRCRHAIACNSTPAGQAPKCLQTQCKLSMAGSRLSQRAHWVCAVYARCSHAYHLISTPIWPRRRASGHRSWHVASAAAECSSSARVHGGTRATSICR